MSKSSSDSLDNDRLVDAVKEDPQLKPIEKETSFRFAKCDDRVHVYSEEAGIIRRLMQHSEFEIKTFRITDEDVWGKRVEPHRFDGGTITGVEGYAPVGVLKFAARSRSTSGHAAVVSRAGEPMSSQRIGSDVETVARRLREADLTDNRFADVDNGKKKSYADHSDPSEQLGPTGVSGNYGVYAGSGLVLLDIDDYTEEVDTDGLTAALSLPDTFTVESPHTDGENGGHRYYHVTGDVVEAIKAVNRGKANACPSWGEVRVQNQYVVGPGSRLNGCHKEGCEECATGDGGLYTIRNDAPIATITADELVDVLRVDEEIQSREEDTSQPRLDDQPVTDFPPLEYDDTAVAVVKGAIREFQQDSDTTQRAFDYLMDLVSGRYGQRGYEDDHSGAEIDLASKLYGVLQFTQDDENAREKIYSYITMACRRREYTDTGDVRKWVKRGDNYRGHVLEDTTTTFVPELWDRWRHKRKGPRRWNGEYGSIVRRHVLKSVSTAYEERPGYPTKKEIVDIAQGLNPERSRRTHEEVLRRLRTKDGQVKMAHRGGNDYVYYLAMEPDPPDAEGIACNEEYVDI